MTTYESEFAGLPDVPHVADSERPFAAMMSAVSGFSVEAVQRTLIEAGLSQPDETLGKIRLEGSKHAVTVSPIPLRGARGPEGVLDRIMDRLDSGDGVALYHRADHDRNSPYTWTLLAGFEIDEYEMPGAVRAINPQRDHANYFARHKMLDLIKGSTLPEEPAGRFTRAARRVVDYLTGADLGPKPTTGIYAYAVDPEYIHGPLTLIWEDEEKPEPTAEPTYSATGQDKVRWPKPGSEPASEAGATSGAGRDAAA